MKRIILAVAALIAACSFGASYKDWFTPKSGWNNQKVPVRINVSNWKYIENYPVNSQIGDIARNLEGWIAEQEIPESAKNAFKLSVSALANSIYAACQAQMNKVKIDNLGAALEGMFVSRYGQYQDEAGNVISKTKSGIDTSKFRQQLIANKNAVVSGGQASGGSEQNPLKLIITQKPYDELQFEQHKADGKSLTSLKGWYDLQDNPQDDALGGSDYWAFGTYGYYFPISWGKSTELEWARWNGWDESCLSAGDDGGTGSQNNKPLHLRHWNGGDGGCGETLQNLLTNKNQSIAADRKKHYFLTRYGENNAQTHELHWLSMDEAAMEVSGGEPNVDDHSIVLEKDEDASSNDAPKKLRLKGFDAAKSARTADVKVPIVPNIQPTGDDLHWDKFSDFFADSVFKTSDTTGKVLLNGTKEGDKKVQVLALSYGDTDDDQTLSHFSGDGKSIDLGFTPDGQTVESPLAQLHNFDNPERNGAKTEYDIADILTNVNHSTDGWYFPLRNAQGVLQYAQASKITGIPSASVDGKTIENTRDTDASETAPTKLRIFGSQTATEGQVLKMGKGGEVVWDDAAGVGLDCEVADIDKFPLYTNIVNGVVKFGLQNWETLDNVNGVYGKKESHPVMWRMDDSKSLECDTTHDTIEIANSVSAVNRAIPFKDKTNSEGDTIGWLAPPQTNPNGKYLKITGTGNSATLAWADGSRGVPVDEASITTNYNHGATQNGVAGIYGFRTADAGDVPHKKADGTIEWKPVAAGGALLVQGNYDSTVATCTNKLIFASESDSNVKFKVTQGENGNVTVTVGVYWVQ